MNKLKLIFSATILGLCSIGIALVKATTGEPRAMSQKKYNVPTSEQEKLLNRYLNPYAMSDLASAKRTAELKQAAVKTNNEEKAIKLVKQINLNPNYKLPAAMDASRSSLIHLAVFKGYFEFLKFLVEQMSGDPVKMREYVNTPNATRWTPLHIAARLDSEIYKNKLEIIKFLVEHGANLDSKIADVPRPIDLVVPDSKLNFEVIRYLMDKMFGAVSSKKVVKKK